jgi:hypothetical protein
MAGGLTPVRATNSASLQRDPIDRLNERRLSNALTTSSHLILLTLTAICGYSRMAGSEESSSNLNLQDTRALSWGSHRRQEVPTAGG